MISGVKHPGLMGDLADGGSLLNDIWGDTGAAFDNLNPVAPLDVGPASLIGLHGFSDAGATGGPGATWTPGSTPSSTPSSTLLYGSDFGTIGPGGTDSVTVANSGSVSSTATGPSASRVASASSSSSFGVSPFVIKVTWDASVAAAPTGFTQAVMAAIAYLESQISTAATVNIDVGYGEVDGYTLGSNSLGSSLSYLSSTSYAALRSAYASDATSSTQTAALASLPSSDPISGTLWTTTAEAKSLGLMAPRGTGLDGYIGFSSTLPFTYDDSQGVASGSYDFNGVALHELSEIMGRMLLAGGTIGSYANSYSLMDLFHYSAPGVRDLSTATPGYLSANAGTSSIATLNTVSGGDGGDWSSAMGTDSFDAYSNSGVVNAVSSNDLTALNLLGWTLSGTGTTTSSTATSSTATTSTATAITAAPQISVSVAMQTAHAASVETGSGLAASTAFAQFGQSGGASSDSYSFTLSGPNAAGFSLASSGNAGVLSVGSAGAASSGAGTAYALDITATDATTSVSSAPFAVQIVVVAGSSSTMVTASSLSGLVSSSTPTFIFGNAGHETISAQGLTGIVWFDAGAGTTLTGGSYINDFVFGAATASPQSAADVITNFNTGLDFIDLTGLGQSLAYQGQISGSASGVAANSIAWTQSGGNTFVDINTTSASQAVGATSMQIELLGTISLAGSNFLHS